MLDTWYPVEVNPKINEAGVKFDDVTAKTSELAAEHTHVAASPKKRLTPRKEAPI